jgi:hypothetical protein
VKPSERVLLTIKAEHPLWQTARADAASAMLPFVLREIVEGNVTEALVSHSDWAKLQGYLRGLPGGREKLPLAVAEAPEPEKPEATERAVAARKMAELIKTLGAVSPFGGDVVREESGRYYAVPFALGTVIMGMVRVWSIGYVNVSYTARCEKLPPEGLPILDNRTFAGIDDAARFLTLAIYTRDYKAALAVPLRKLKEKGQK